MKPALPDRGRRPDLDPDPDPNHHPDPQAINRGQTLSAVLLALAQQTDRERITIGDLLAALGDRALGALLFIFAVPNVLPMPPGTSTLLGAPLIFLAAQLMLGRGPWLPAVVARRSLAHADFAVLVRRVVPWLQRAERLLRPRLPWVAGARTSRPRSPRTRAGNSITSRSVRYSRPPATGTRPRRSTRSWPSRSRVTRAMRSTRQRVGARPGTRARPTAG